VTFTRKEFEAAFATIPLKSLEERSWLWRVNSWDLVVEGGALQAAFLRRWSLYADMRKIAPDFYDWLLGVFPASEDPRILAEHAARARSDVA